MGIDLYVDLGTPRLSFRRLRLLLERAALDSEYAREVVGPQARWSTTEYLLANLIDAVQVGNWQFAAANTPKGKQRPERPKPVERPGETAKRNQYRTQLSDREILRRLVQQQRNPRG